jgi:hypothetical protein
VTPDRQLAFSPARIPFSRGALVYGAYIRRIGSEDAVAIKGRDSSGRPREIRVYAAAGAPDLYTAMWNGNADSPSTTMYATLGEAQQQEVVTFAAYADDLGNHRASILNQPFQELMWWTGTHPNSKLPGFILDEIRIGGTGTLALLYLVIVPRHHDDAEIVSAPHYAPYVRAAAPAVVMGEGVSPGDPGGRAREPGVLLIDDGTLSGRAEWLEICEQRNRNQPQGETPRRLVGRFMSYSAGARKIERGPLVRLVQPAGWMDGTQDVALANFGRRTYGRFAGMATCVHVFIQGNPSVLGAAIEHSASWSLSCIDAADDFKSLLSGQPRVPNIIFTAPNGPDEFITTCPGGSINEMPQGGPFAEREFLGISTRTPRGHPLGTGPRIMYRDVIDGRLADWRIGGTVGPEAYNPSISDQPYYEFSTDVSPDGTIWGVGRQAAPGGRDSNDNLGIFKSTDGGLTLQYVRHLTRADGFTGPYAGHRIVQLDRGKAGFGRFALVRAIRGSGVERYGIKVSIIEDAGWRIDPAKEYVVIRDHVFTSSGAFYAPIFGGQKFLLAYEQSAGGGTNNRSSAHAAIVDHVAAV